MTLHHLSGLGFSSPKHGTSMTWSFHLLDGLYLSNTSGDRQVLQNIGAEGILLLHQFMDHHFIVVVHLYESAMKYSIK
jgi:hypothetical protein